MEESKGGAASGALKLSYNTNDIKNFISLGKMLRN